MRSIRYFILISISLLSLSTVAFAEGYAGFANNSNAYISIELDTLFIISRHLYMSADQKWCTAGRTEFVFSVLNLDIGMRI